MRTVMLCVIALTACSAAAQDPIRHDPFLKPLIETMPVLADPLGVPEPAPAGEPPELRGILHSPRETLVNLDGKLLAIGDNFERFTVVAVGERNAVLSDGSQQVVVSIDDERSVEHATEY